MDTYAVSRAPVSVITEPGSDLDYFQSGAIDNHSGSVRLATCSDRGEGCSEAATSKPILNSLRPPGKPSVVELYSEGRVAYGVENQEVAESLRYAVSVNGACGLRHATNIRHMSNVQDLAKSEERSTDDN